MTTMKQTEEIRAKAMRERLKAMVQNEIEKLPERLEALEPKDRVQVLFKLMPYVFPKVETVHFKEGESIDSDDWT
jgi:hypothetical protein